MSTPIGTLGNVNNVTMGGMQVFAPQSGLIQLAGDMGANNKVSTLRNFTNAATSNVGYTPSGSNNFYMTGFLVQSVSGSNPTDVRLGYGNTDVGWLSSSLPTSPWGIGFGTISALGDAANMFNFSPNSIGSTGEFTYRQQTPLFIKFPNGKYPFVIWNSSLSVGDGVLIFGYEAP